MIRKINGTENIKLLMGRINDSLKTIEPAQKSIGHEIQLTRGSRQSGIYTSKTNGSLDKITMIFVDSIAAAFDNYSGRMIIEKKPVLMTKNRVFKKIEKFLKKIQPENRIYPKRIDSHFHKLDSDTFTMESLEDYGKYKIIAQHSSNMHDETIDLISRLYEDLI